MGHRIRPQILALLKQRRSARVESRALCEAGLPLHSHEAECLLWVTCSCGHEQKHVTPRLWSVSRSFALPCSWMQIAADSECSLVRLQHHDMKDSADDARADHHLQS